MLFLLSPASPAASYNASSTASPPQSSPRSAGSSSAAATLPAAATASSAKLKLIRSGLAVLISSLSTASPAHNYLTLSSPEALQQLLQSHESVQQQQQQQQQREQHHGAGSAVSTHTQSSEYTQQGGGHSMHSMQSSWQSQCARLLRLCCSLVGCWDGVVDAAAVRVLGLLTDPSQSKLALDAGECAPDDSCFPLCAWPVICLGPWSPVFTWACLLLLHLKCFAWDAVCILQTPAPCLGLQNWRSESNQHAHQIGILNQINMPPLELRLGLGESAWVCSKHLCYKHVVCADADVVHPQDGMSLCTRASILHHCSLHFPSILSSTFSHTGTKASIAARVLEQLVHKSQADLFEALGRLLHASLGSNSSAPAGKKSQADLFLRLLAGCSLPLLLRAATLLLTQVRRARQACLRPWVGCSLPLLLRAAVLLLMQVRRARLPF